jgi:hypothetical protein
VKSVHLSFYADQPKPTHQGMKMLPTDAETISNALRRVALGLDQISNAMTDAAYWLQRAARATSQDAEPGSSPGTQDTGSGNHASDGAGPAVSVAESEACVATSGAGTEGGSSSSTSEEPVPASDLTSEVTRARREKILNLYSANRSLGWADLNGKVGYSRKSGPAKTWISMGRAAGDPRVLKGDELRGKTQVAAAIKEAEKPTVAAPQRKPPPGKVLVAEPETRTVFGPAGQIVVPTPMLITLGKMADGNAYDIGALVDAGAWPSADALRDNFSRWDMRLEQIGVELVKVGRQMYRVRRI